MHKLTSTQKGLCIALLVTLTDLISKWMVYTHLVYGGKIIEITAFFNLVERWNKGVSFSLFSDSGKLTFYILSLVSVIVISALVFWLRKEKKIFPIVALGLVIGGALGNLCDRLYNGAVFDFLDFHIASYHWPAFNFADFSIVIGTFMLIITCVSFNPNKEKGNKK